MDPLSALSIAGTIVQFVDFAIKVVSKGNQIYRSGDGSLDENHDLEVVTNDLLVLQTKLDQFSQRGGSDARPTEEEVILRRLSNTANELARSLLTRLNQVKAQGRFRRWKSFRQAIKSISSQKEIDSLARRLKLVKDEFQIHVLVMLKDKLDTFATQQISKLDLLDKSSRDLLTALQEHRSLAQENRSMVQESRSVVQESTVLDAERPREASNYNSRNSKEFPKFSRPRNGEEQRRVQGPKPNSGEIYELEGAILKSLSFSGMGSRHEAVAEAHCKTFSWILKGSQMEDLPWDDYGQWLQHGSSLYWLSGKAASGKSTLMKYLISHLDVMQALTVWSNQKTLLCANFFFWNTGTVMQKSQAGLLRSLLYQIFTNIPQNTKNKADDLMRRTMPEMWQRVTVMHERAVEKSKARGEEICQPLSRLRDSWYSWTLPELKEVFERLMQETKAKFRLCFFIDGLDEFDGDHNEIVILFKHVASFPHAKLSVSSRPLLIFEQEFESSPKLRLQDLTRNDIKLYTHDKLSAHRRILQLSRQNPVFLQQLVNEVLEMSSGVFLWVNLAVKSLLKGLTNSDSISDLLRRLRDLPPELDDLYSLMLRSIQPKFYVEQASRLFQIVYQADSPISALALSFADEPDTKLALETLAGTITSIQKRERVEAMATRLKSRCAGLLELRDSSNPRMISVLQLRPILLFRAVTDQLTFHLVVQYLHLTVKEFLEKADVWSTLLNSTKATDFDANVALLRSDILLLKCSNERWVDEQWTLIDMAMCHARRAENSTGEAQTALLDELDCTGYSLVKFDQKSARRERNIHWSAAMHSIDQHCHNCPESFLTFAISNGLALYVESKLNHYFHQANKHSIRPLLLYATVFVPVYHKRKMASLHLSMLAMLLRERLSPNETFQGSTPWRRLLSHILSTSEDRDANLELEQSWLEGCKLMLMHGADPNSYAKRSTTPPDSSVQSVQIKVSALEIIEVAFAHLPRRFVDEVKTMIVQKSALISRGGLHQKRKQESGQRHDDQSGYHYKRSKTMADPIHDPYLVRICSSTNPQW